MVKLPHTIFNAAIEDSLNRGVHELPKGFLINDFILEGYGREKAQKHVEELISANRFEVKNGLVKF